MFLFYCINAFSNGNRKSQTTTENMTNFDVAIYGATPSGIMAAVAVKKRGKSVVIIEPSRWVGGILGAGLKPRQDCPNIEAVGGMTRPLIERLGVRQGKTSNRDINPADIRSDFLDLLDKNNIDIFYEHRINRCKSKNGKIISAIFDYAPFTKNGIPPESAEINDKLTINAKIFIDASYEGELMARAGVSFRSGREAKNTYGEDLAGVQPPQNLTPIDPFVVPGNSKSGLLPLIDLDHGKPVGAGDHYTQAYNYRFYLTSDPAFKAIITPPVDYDPQKYELVGRYVEYLKEQKPADLEKQLAMIFPGWMNAGEYNYQRASLVTMAPVGLSHLYINGDYSVKSKIWKEHQDYLKGLYHFMCTDPRVPKTYQGKIKDLGLDLRPHPDTNGWPHQLYVRVSRRLMGPYTITAHDVYNKTKVEAPIGLAQYGIDTYPARRIVLEQNGEYFVALEGKMFVGGAKGPTNVPYPISYKAITPSKKECGNLLVPICFSASHLGYASARMEPVFMINGESAGIAAVQAIDEGVLVQDINMERFQNELKAAGQILNW